MGQFTNILPLLKNKQGNKKWVCFNDCHVTFKIEIYQQHKQVLGNLKSMYLDNLSISLNQLFSKHSVYKLGQLDSCYWNIEYL